MNVTATAVQHPMFVAAATSLALLAAYLLGSLSFAVIVSRAMGLSDPRSYGSKNPGATNVLRSGNKQAAVLTLAFDALKGYFAVVLVFVLGPHWGLSGQAMATVAACAGLAAFLGHLWPIFFRFQGGKGVATAAGALMAINPILGLAVLAAAAFAPFFQALIWGFTPMLAPIGLMSLLLVWRHQGNIKKLLAGTESKLGQKAIATPQPPNSES
jgi:acyl phosphate:glycerol-3-phosphate acyltransferase